MSKYSSEFKLEVVNYYFKENTGYVSTANHFKIAHACVERWIKRYKIHGIKGLSKNLKASYDGFFKQSVVEYMYKNHLSYQETSAYFNLASDCIVSNWDRIYREKGPQAFYESNRGRPRKMNSNKQKNKKELSKEEELMEENKRLRMENEYLKKLNALVQERIKRENKKK